MDGVCKRGAPVHSSNINEGKNRKGFVGFWDSRGTSLRWILKSALYAFLFIVFCPAIGLSADSSPRLSYLEMVQFERQCRARLAGSCAPSQSPLVEIQRLACVSEQEALGCRAYFQESGEPIENLRRCDIDTICQEQTRSEIEGLTECARGAAAVAIDLFKGGVGLVDWAWETSVKGYQALEGAIRRCQSDPKCGRLEKGALEAALEKRKMLESCVENLSCRRELANTIPSLKSLSDPELEKLSLLDWATRKSAALESEARVRTYARAVGPRATPLPYEDERAANDDLAKGSSSERRSLLVAAGKRWLEKQNIRLQCYNKKAADQLLCYGVFSVVDPTFGAGYALKLYKAGRAVRALESLALDAERASKRMGAARAGEAAIAGSMKTRAQMIREYLTREPTTTTQNEAWMNLAAKPSGGKGQRYFLDVENSKLKELNDTLLDKNLVTSLNNRYKEILDQKIKDVRSRFGGRSEVYSDFKSIRYAFDGAVSPQLRAELERAVQSANREFGEELAQMKLVRATDPNPATWFRAGAGETADEATAAARYSRAISGDRSIRSFSDPVLQEKISTTLSYTHLYRERLAEKFRGTLMEGERGAETLSREAWEVIRKAKNDRELRSSLEATFGIKSLDAQAVSDLRTYTGLVDEFSPGLHIAKREVATLDTASAGGFSADFSGLGAENLKSTEMALARAKKLEEALRETRLEEQGVTSAFNQRKDKFQEVVASALSSRGHVLKTICSGDDCVAIPTQALSAADKRSVIQALSKESENPSRIRLSFVGPQVKDASVRGVIAVQGETLEKSLRVNLQGRIPKDKLEGLLFGVDMHGSVPGSGEVSLIIGRRNGLAVTEKERSAIEAGFRQAIDSMNLAVSRNGTRGTYSLSEIVVP